MRTILFDMTAEDKTDLARLLGIVFGSNTKAVGYVIRPHVQEGEERSTDVKISFYWTAPPSDPNYVSFPFKMDASGSADFVSRWLEEADYGPEPDIDGSVRPGWRVHDESNSGLFGDYRVIFSASPKRIVYGK